MYRLQCYHALQVGIFIFAQSFRGDIEVEEFVAPLLDQSLGTLAGLAKGCQWIAYMLDDIRVL